MLLKNHLQVLLSKQPRNSWGQNDTALSSSFPVIFDMEATQQSFSNRQYRNTKWGVGDLGVIAWIVTL